MRLREELKKLINIILCDEKVAKTTAEKRTYEDEPILMPASRLKGYLPEKYRQMRQIAYKREGIYYDTSRLFYEQGKFMEDFEDDYQFDEDFVRYFPTYRDLTDSQLRGYFSWRTKVRRGEVESTALSFVFIYIYELLNGIGVQSAEDGFRKIRNFWQEYRKYNPSVDRYVELWLKDYVVYNNLDKKYLEEFYDFSRDEKILTVMNCENESPESLFEALNRLSSYNFERSAFYKKYSTDVQAVTKKAFLKLKSHYEKNRKNSLFDNYFGKPICSSYTMFGSAVFYFRERKQDFVYEVNPVHRYYCNSVRWTSERFFPSKNKNKKVGNFLKAIDFHMRGLYGFNPPLQNVETTKILSGIIAESIEEYLNEKREAEKRQVRVDTSVLQRIREVSLETQKKLIVEEEEEAEEQEKITEEIVNETSLSDDEYYFLRCLLYGAPYGDFVKKKSLMVSVLADAINEKMFDMFCDTVILLDGDSAEVIEDYTEELKEIVKK